MVAVVSKALATTTTTGTTTQVTSSVRDPLELIVDVCGQVRFASTAARAWLAQPGCAEQIADNIRACADATVDVSERVVGNARILRLAADDGRALFLVHVAPAAPAPASRSMLTTMQQRVAERAALGMTIDDVAAELEMTAHTARSHLKEVYRRLYVSNRVELANALRG